METPSLSLGADGAADALQAVAAGVGPHDLAALDHGNGFAAALRVSWGCTTCFCGHPEGAAAQGAWSAWPASDGGRAHRCGRQAWPVRHVSHLLTSNASPARASPAILGAAAGSRHAVERGRRGRQRDRS